MAKKAILTDEPKKRRQRRRMLRIPPGYKSIRGVKMVFAVLNELPEEEFPKTMEALSKVSTSKNASNQTPGYVCVPVKGLKLTDEFMKALSSLVPKKRRRRGSNKKK